MLNNPIRFNDPTGHVCSDPEDLWSPGCDGGGGSPPNTPAPLPPAPVVITNPDPLDEGLQQNKPTVYDVGALAGSTAVYGGSLYVGTGLGIVGGLYSSFAALMLRYRLAGNNLIISGGRALRGVAGFNPYTNRIGIGNLRGLFSGWGGFRAGYASSLTWAGAAVNILGDINDYANGTYDGSDLAAAILVDTVTTVGFAAVAGAVAGLVSGAVAGAVGGTVVVPGIGTVSGAAVGAVAGAVAGLSAGITLSYGFNSYEVSDGQTLRDAAISSISSGFDSLFSP